ncbi:MAG: YlmH/Sll1252 family protein, partial [Oscillospiraceae bacterium]
MAFSFLNEDERFLSAHISDLQRLSAKSGVPRFSAFLNEREAVVAENSANQRPLFYGGYDGAARVVCGFVQDTYAQELEPCDIFPITPLTFYFRKCDSLSHRDFLGAMLSLEIKRELIGDILIAQGYAVVFVHD